MSSNLMPAYFAASLSKDSDVTPCAAKPMRRPLRSLRLLNWPLSTRSSHEHGLIEIARLRVPAVGDDAKLDPTDERVPEADRKRAAADVELAGTERRDDLRARVEHDQVDVQAFVLEETLVVGDVKRRIARRTARSDRDLVRRLRRDRKVRRQHAGERGPDRQSQARRHRRSSCYYCACNLSRSREDR